MGRRLIAALLLFISGFASALLIPNTLEKYSKIEVRPVHEAIVCDAPETLECLYERVLNRCRNGLIEECQRAHQYFGKPEDRWLTIEVGEPICRNEGPRNQECMTVYHALLDLTTEDQADRFAIDLCDRHQWSYGCTRKLRNAARDGAKDHELFYLTENLCRSFPIDPYLEPVCDKIRKGKGLIGWKDIKDMKVSLFYKFSNWDGIVQQTFSQTLYPARSPADQ